MPRCAPSLRITLLTAAVFASPAAAQPSFTGLGDLAGGADSSTAVAVSANGSVVAGHSEHSGGATQGFRRQGGVLQGLGIPPGTGMSSWTVSAMSADGSKIIGDSFGSLVVWDAGVLSAMK